MLILDTLQTWRMFTIEKVDSRVKDWLFVGDPVPLLLVWLLYMSFVFLGPKWMVCTSAYIAFEFAYTAWMAGYSLGCQPVDYSRSILGMRMVNVCWLFFITKVFELLDTIFMILRKKSEQVTFLHVFHHSTMIWTWWSGVSYIGGGQSFLSGFLNSSVHTVMYSYYALSALGPWIQPYLWWKRYITGLQLVQFLLIICNAITLIFFVQPCDFPVVFCWILFIYCLIMLVLFCHFYVRSYLKKGVPGTRKDPLNEKSKLN